MPTHDCVVCRDFHQNDGEPCPADLHITIKRNDGTTYETHLCYLCADGVNLNVLLSDAIQEGNP